MRNFLDPDRHRLSTILVRLTGLFFAATVLWNLGWVIAHGNLSAPAATAITICFAIATFAVTLNGLVLVINNWRFRSMKPRKLDREALKPTVGIIIPTCGESPEIVLNTLSSIVGQDWPKSKRIIVVSDDAHSDLLEVAVANFIFEHEEPGIIYHRPPHRDHPLRRGEAKAGNLNSALQLLMSRFPYISFIETRDADDLVGTRHFLSYCLRVLMDDPDVSFVQTIKRCRTKRGDPFSNQESVFYERVMPTRFASNAVFPCGSGLLWRLRDLRKIGGFPVWNLVEDLQSGYEVLRNGGRGVFLPIVGAVGQIAPHDIPNFYKQRGTWALDTIRLLYWKNPLWERGLDLWQRLQFLELESSYLLSFVMLLFIATLLSALLFNIYPVTSSPLEYYLHLGALAAVFELFNYVKARGIAYRDQWRSREIWMGLMPVFIIAAFRALYYGPRRKPAYRVTRKYHQISWYWKETFVQKSIVGLLTLGIVLHVLFLNTDWPMSMISIFWSAFFIYSLSRVIKNSWHGIDVKDKIARSVKALPEAPIIKKAVSVAQIAIF